MDWPETFGDILSRSPHGERGLKYRPVEPNPFPPRRSPHGERGLKSDEKKLEHALYGRSPHGERGLKSRRFDEGK